MIAGMRIMKFAGIVVLYLGSLSSTTAASTHKKVKKPQLPTLPSGPTGPIQQVPLDLMAPVAPQVSYQNGQLMIVAPNSTLGDILRAVRKQTGAEIEVPDAKERVVTHLGPAPAAEVMAELLNGSRFNYILLGSPDDGRALTRVVLVAKSGPDNAAPSSPMTGQQQSALTQPPDQQEMTAEANDADAAEEQPAEENADQSAAEAEQPVAQPDQSGVKTPQQLLQEMQQRQLQMQQQQQTGQPPIPGPVQRQEQ